ncbi:hypothetical protein [Nocardioides aequoreus]|uniref:hypothetical protein n=1 Tax=Nocardioides aequoreus TaxID=397278 RepID=UPI0012F63831|nr:hypothetical protein [Nocardioides aequoreus]
MSGMQVPPGRLRAFAGECRDAADALSRIDATSVGSGVTGDLPSTRTAEAVETVGADVDAAMEVLAGRLRAMADVADGTQDDYEATEAEIVAGFDAMSR